MLHEIFVDMAHQLGGEKLKFIDMFCGIGTIRMEFIKAEEFLKQDEEIQKAFLEWWKPKFGDLASFKGISKHSFGENEDYCFVNEYNEEREQDQYIDSYGIELYNMFCIGNDFSKYGFSFKSRFDVIPLLTEGQLRKFIEDMSHCNMLILWNMYYGDIYQHKVCFSKKSNFNEIDLKRCENLLEAYWKAALEIAKEKVKA